MKTVLNDIIGDISNLITFNSSQAPAQDGAPFGKGAKAALEYFLNLAASFGFETKNYDGYAGEVIFGDGEEFAILAHLDVVPAGDGWTHKPFAGEIDEKLRRVWGRGAMDDKGPAVAALYALKAIKDEGIIPKRRIKLIVGCNEESGWACIDYYKKHAHMPDEGFSPDADFPVIYAEKGIIHVKLKFDAQGDFTALCGGSAANMVCDRCETALPETLTEKQKKIIKEYALKTENEKIVSLGKSAHGSTPEKGKNAIRAVLKFAGLESIEDELFVNAFGLKSFSDETGSLTFSPNVISGGKNVIYIICDVRYPATMPRLSVFEAFERAGVEYEILSEQAPLFNDKNCTLIKTLCEVYNEVTGKNAKPIAIGGGTYARALKCGAAFGPEEDGEENTVHQPDEYITFDKIERCYKIYTLALKRLCC